MGYRSSRGADTETATERVTNHRWNNDATQNRSSDCTGPMSLEQAEAEFGMTVPDRDTMVRLQRLEASNPRRIHEWIDEGMPVDVMGDPLAIDAVRERQAERPAAVPTNIEHQHIPESKNKS